MTLKTREEINAYFPDAERTGLVDQADLKDLVAVTPFRTSDEDPDTVAGILAAAASATGEALGALNLGTAATHAESDFATPSYVDSQHDDAITQAHGAMVSYVGGSISDLNLGTASTHATEFFQAAGDYATNTALTSGLAAKADTTALTSGLATKADATATTNALALKAPLASPALTGVPTAPTAALGTNTTQIATTAGVRAEISALVASAPTALDTLNELAAALGNDANFAATTATALGNKQPLDATLTALAALTTSADTIIYATGADTFSQTTLSAFGRTLIDDADAATARTTLGLGTAATQASTAFETHNTNLTQLSGLSLVADRLPYANGTGTLALTTLTSAGRALIDDANADAQLTTLGLPTGIKSLATAMQTFENYVELYINAYDDRNMVLKNVAYLDASQIHQFQAPGATNSFWNFQGTGGKSKMTLAFTIEFKPTNTQEGGQAAVNGMGFFYKGVASGVGTGTGSGNGTGSVFAMNFGTSGQRIDFQVWTNGTTGNVVSQFNLLNVDVLFAAGTIYNFYIEYDGNGATNNDRLKIWVNGVQLTMSPGSGAGQASATDLPAQFQNPSSASNIFCFGKSAFNQASTYGFDGRMWNFLAAGTLLGGATAAAALNNTRGMSIADINALNYTLGCFCPMNETPRGVNNAKQVAADVSGNGRHLSRINGVGFDQLIMSLYDPYSGGTFIPAIKPDGTLNLVNGVLVPRIQGAPSWEYTDRLGYFGNRPVIRLRRGRGLCAIVENVGDHTTGAIYDYVCYNNASASECFYIGYGNYQWVNSTDGSGYGDINNKMIVYGVTGTAEQSDGGQSAYVRYDGGDMQAGNPGLPYPNASINCLATIGTQGGQNVDGSKGLAVGNTAMVAGAPWRTKLSCFGAGVGHGSTPGPWGLTIDAGSGDVAQTIWIADGTNNQTLPDGWLSRIPNKRAITLGGDPANDWSINYHVAVGPYFSSTDDEVALHRILQVAGGRQRIQ